jgi:hypothetical protein
MYSVKDLHYGFRRRANKVETLQNRNFFVEQIDDYLNEALTIYVRSKMQSVEKDQDDIDDLRQLIKSEVQLLLQIEELYTNGTLPIDYYRLLKSYSIATSKQCSQPKRLSHYSVQADDEESFLKDELYKPSYEWGETGYRIIDNVIRVYTNNEFDITNIVIDYLYKHPRIANPEDSRNGTYTLPSGVVAIQQDLILDSTNQPEIIMDIAVMNAYMDISDPNYSIKLNKLINVHK